MAKRLVKIASELNVGTSTIVEFLNGNGFEIDNKPTAKVSEEMYEALLKEFQKSIDIKEKADRINIGTRTKKDTPSPSSQVGVLDSPAQEKTPPPSKPEEKKPREEEPVLKTETPAPKLKVLGKVDLESRLQKRGKTIKPTAGETPEPEQEVPQVKEPDLTAKAEPKQAEEPQPAAPKAPEKEQEPAAKKEPEAEKAPEKTPVTPPAVEGEKEGAEPPAAASAKELVADAGKTPAADQVIKAEAPELRGLKILGKIDTDKLKRPKKKKKKEGPEVKESEQKKEPAPAANSADDQKRRKRKRKKITVEGPGKGGGDRQRGPRTKGKSTREEPQEVSQKEIEENIKATMARLSGKGKKKRQRLQRDKRDRMREKQELIETEKLTGKLQVTEFISVQELANLMDVPATEVIMTCMNLGIIVSINQRLDAEIIELVAEEFGHEIEFITSEEETDEEVEVEDDPEDLEPRAPIVTVMGHVDHGKTSLLDFIRKANVVSGEAGGITQHIGAYEVKVGEQQQKITFLDTPGHEAFTAMRARGAKVTDVAIVIIAADDSIMPQTREAISHAQAAGVPIIFAINKVDKPGAQPERIKEELANMNLLVEEWGGKYQSQDISAKTGQGIDELLEKILLEAELLELKANPHRMSIGTVIEASLDKGRGYVTKLLVQNGSLNVGDPIVAGEYSGKVKAMLNEFGKRIQSAGPSQPVMVLGLDGAPQAGDRFKEVEDEPEARQIASRRAQISREQANRASKRISLDEIGRRLALGTFKELNLIVKGDVDGSVEALADSLIKLSIETVQVNIIHQAVGQIIESDVLLASASDAIIIGFQVRPSMGARKLAEKEGVQIKTYSIIYEAIDEIKSAIEGMLEPTREEKIVGEAEVREVFKISKVGTIAGCLVREGRISRNHHIRLIRDGIVVYPSKEGQHGELASLKRFKDDIKEVKSGLECGIGIKNFNDIKVGDFIEAYEIIEVKQTLS